MFCRFGLSDSKKLMLSYTAQNWYNCVYMNTCEYNWISDYSRAKVQVQHFIQNCFVIVVIFLECLSFTVHGEACAGTKGCFSFHLLRVQSFSLLKYHFKMCMRMSLWLRSQFNWTVVDIGFYFWQRCSCKINELWWKNQTLIIFNCVIYFLILHFTLFELTESKMWHLLYNKTPAKHVLPPVCGCVRMGDSDTSGSLMVVRHSYLINQQD